jgi:Tol biopolymer transport system component
MEANPTPNRPRRRARRGAAALLSGAIASTALVLATPQAASALPTPAFTSLVSRNDAGVVSNGASSFPDLSGDGRFVAFQSGANNLVTGDSNGTVDIFVRDRVAARTERVSLTDADAQATGGSSTFPSISDDGRRVAFLSSSNSFIPGDDKGRIDAFVRDRTTGSTIRVVTGLGGALLDDNVVDVEISGNGRYVAFVTAATNVVSGDTNGETDIFVRDLQTGVVERVSVNSSEQQGSGWSFRPSISDDGRYVAFDTSSLLAGGAPGKANAYVRDRSAGTTSIVNVSSEEVVGSEGGGSPIISGDGRYVAFASDSSNLVANDANGTSDTFRRDLVAGVTTRITWSDSDVALSLGGYPMSISDNGNEVGFRSSSQATSAPDAGTDADLFVRTVSTASTRRVSTSTTVPDPAIAVSDGPIGMSDDGRQVAFGHTNKLVADAAFDQTYVNGPLEISPLPEPEGARRPAAPGLPRPRPGGQRARHPRGADPRRQEPPGCPHHRAGAGQPVRRQAARRHPPLLGLLPAQARPLRAQLLDQPIRGGHEALGDRPEVRPELRVQEPLRRPVERQLREAGVPQRVRAPARRRRTRLLDRQAGSQGAHPGAT